MTPQEKKIKKLNEDMERLKKMLKENAAAWDRIGLEITEAVNEFAAVCAKIKEDISQSDLG